MVDLTFHRSAGGYRDLLRKYRILIDGIDKGGVGEGDALTISVPAGVRKIEARIDWTRSEPLKLELRDGESLRFEVRRGPWYALFRRTGYVKLAVTDGP